MRLLAPLDLSKNELRNARVQNLSTPPSSPVLGQLYYDTDDNNLYVWDGTWTDLTAQGTTAPDAGTSTKGLIQLAGDLGGTGTTAAVPVISVGAIDAGKISATLKPSGTAAAGTEALRALGTTATTAAAGNDARLSDARTPLAHTHPQSDVTNLSTDLAAKAPLASPTFTGVPAAPTAAAGTNTTQLATTAYVMARTPIDGAAGTASLRTLGTTGTTAAAGNDARLSDTRTPTASSIVDAMVAAGAAIAESKLSLASDAAAGTASRRTLGTGATQAAAGNHTHATLHTQNTDLGTTSTTFYLVGTAATDVRIKKSASGELSARLGDDSGFAAVQTGALTVNGNLTVTGTTTSINSNTLSVGDNQIELNNDITTTAASTQNAGLLVRRYTGADVLQASELLWDETTDRWSFVHPASSGTGTVARIGSLKYTATLGAITASTPVTVTHSLNTLDVIVSIREVATGEIVYADPIAATVDTITLTFGASHASSAFVVTVMG